MKKQIRFVLLALIMTLVSVNYHRHFKGIVGNMCEETAANPSGFCYEMLPQGGFPFSYLYDDPSTSIVGKLGVADLDNFVTGWFLLDVFTFYLILNITSLAYSRLDRRKRKAASREAALL